MTAHTITTITAADKRTGLTVADLIVWTQYLRNLDVDPRTPVRARVGFRAQLLELAPRAGKETGDQ